MKDLFWIEKIALRARVTEKNGLACVDHCREVSNVGEDGYFRIVF